MSQGKTKSSALYGSLSRRYARALIDLAKEEKQLESCGTELSQLVLAFQENSDIFRVLSDQFSPMTQRQKTIAELSGQLGLSALLKNFLFLLVKKERILLLTSIAREYQTMQDTFLGIARVTISATQKPEPAVITQIETLLTKNLKKQVIAQVELDPEMIGGLSIRIDNLVYDGSIRKELEKMRERMTQETL